MEKYLMLLILLISGFSFGQNPGRFEEIDQKMDAIPSQMEASTTTIADYISKNFIGSQDQIRAAFYWTASKIAYDVESLDDTRQPYQTPQEKVKETLKTRKGVCMHYAEVFSDIANKLDIETVIISGYTKSQGKIAPLSHVWCASKLNDSWYVFDPTWGSGYVNDGKYTKKLSNRYYKAEPKVFLTSHMPFDYLWQFSEYPITNQEFYDNKIEAADKRNAFDFMKEVELYQKLPVAEQARASAKRIEKNGVKNSLIAGRLEYENYRISHEKNKDNFSKIQVIIADFKEANTLFKDFLKYRNNRFTPLVSDEKIKNKIQLPYELILKCESNIKEVKEQDVNKENVGNYHQLKASIADAKKNFEIHLNFVSQYLQADKSEREKMFYSRIKRG